MEWPLRWNTALRSNRINRLSDSTPAYLSAERSTTRVVPTKCTSDDQKKRQTRWNPSALKLKLAATNDEPTQSISMSGQRGGDGAYEK